MLAALHPEIIFMGIRRDDILVNVSTVDYRMTDNGSADLRITTKGVYFRL